MTDLRRDFEDATNRFRSRLGAPFRGGGRIHGEGQATHGASAEDVNGYLSEIGALVRRRQSDGRPFPDDLKADLSHILFEKSPKFPELMCGIRVDGSVFDRTLVLKDVHLLGNLNAHKAIFSGGVSLEGSTFEGTQNIGGAQFGAPVAEASSNTVISLNGAVFKGKVVLSGTINGNVDLSGARFEGCLTLAGEYVPKVEIILRSAVVSETFVLNAGGGKGLRVNAEGAVFSGPADFSMGRVRHFGDVVFDRAEFGDQAIFDSAGFEGLASFKGAHFSGASFLRINASRGAMDFSDAEIRAVLDLRSATLEYGPNFSRAVFFRCPRVSETTFPADTRMRNAIFRGFATEDDYQGYRMLKRRFGAFHAREEENMFFAFEQRTRCNLDLYQRRRLVQAILSKLYDWGSEYGQNAGRPLLFFALLTIGSWIGYGVVCGEEVAAANRPSWISDWPPGLGLALQSAVNPLALFWGRALFRPSSGGVAFWVGAQSVLSLVLAALALLAVRRRFRKETD